MARGINLEELREQRGYKPVPDSIPFMGRTEEIDMIEAFRKSEKRILELCGVPMIGKTLLTQEYCNRNNIKHLRMSFKPKPSTPQKDLQEQLFKKNAFNDFSGIEKDTLLIIENFEQALHWTAENDNLHEITAKGIHHFLNEIITNQFKLIIESRFKVRFDDTMRRFVHTERLPAIPTELFWEYYEKKNFTETDFQTLCQKFDEHTGLLALAYNDAEWLYENELVKAVYEPTATSRNLWKLLEIIIRKLEQSERQVLAALTLWQEPISQIELKNALKGYFKGNLDNSFLSLKNKLLIFSQKQAEKQALVYHLNPYLAEVFFSFYQSSAEIAEIKKLPAFQEKQEPEYDRITQEIDKGNFGNALKEIKELRKKQDYEKCLSYLNYALLNPIANQVIILNEIAIAYKYAKNYNKAKEILEKALQINPQDVKTLNELAIIYKQLNQLDKTKKMFLELTEKYKHIPAFNELAIIYKGEGNLDKAKETLEKACKLGNIHSFNELAIIYKNEDNLDKAKEILEKALQIEPSNVKVLNELAIIYKNEDNLDKAKEILEKACKLGNIHSFNELAIIYKEQGDLDKAKEILEKALKTEPSNVKVLNELAIIYKQAGDLDKAKETLEKALQIEPSNVKVLNELAIIYKHKGNLPKAKEILEKTLQIEPSNVKVLNELAIIYKEKHDFINALKTVEKGLLKEPNNRYLKGTKHGILQAQKQFKTSPLSVSSRTNAAGVVREDTDNGKGNLQTTNPMTNFEKASQLIDTLQIAEYFSFMKSLVGENVALTRLQNTFILGKTDVDFYEQLRSLAEMLLQPSAGSSTAAEVGTSARVADLADSSKTQTTENQTITYMNPNEKKNEDGKIVINFNPVINNRNDNTNTNNNSQNQSFNFEAMIEKLPPLKRELKVLQEDHPDVEVLKKILTSFETIEKELANKDEKAVKESGFWVRLGNFGKWLYGEGRKLLQPETLQKISKSASELNKLAQSAGIDTGFENYGSE